MAQMRMLRQVMSPADIYTHADTLCEMLRDHYGSYDADGLDEVMIEETFVQRLAAKGYDLLPEGAEVDDRPMAPPPSRRELPRAEISQLPLRRPGQNGGGIPLRRREPAGDSEGPAPTRGDGGGLPLRRSQPAADGELPGRRLPPSSEGERGGPLRRRPSDSDMPGPLRRRPAMGEGENVGLPRRRPMATGDVGPLRPRPESAPMPRQDSPVEPTRPAPAFQSMPERTVAPAERQAPGEQAQLPPPPVEPAAAVERALEPSEPVAQAATPAVEDAAAAAKPAPKPRVRRSTRAKVQPSETDEPQSQA